MQAPPFPITVALDHATLSVDAKVVQRLVAYVIAAEGHTPGEIGIILTDHATVLALNESYLDHHYHTDVISFVYHDSPAHPIEGEVYIDLDTANERYTEFDSSFEQEALRYVVHGVLHLLGYDDATPEDKQTMHGLEDRYLASLA